MDGPAQNFQDPLNSLQVIFGLLTRTPDPQVQAQTPKKGVSGKSISSGGFGAGGHVIPFQNWDNETNKILGGPPLNSDAGCFLFYATI